MRVGSRCYVSLTTWYSPPDRVHLLRANRMAMLRLTLLLILATACTPTEERLPLRAENYSEWVKAHRPYDYACYTINRIEYRNRYGFDPDPLEDEGIQYFCRTPLPEEFLTTATAGVPAPRTLPTPRPTETTAATSNPQAARPATAVTPTSLAATMPAPTWIQGEWDGTYECRQRTTGLSLTISTAGDSVNATFSFYPVPQNPSVPSGTYVMSGSVVDNVLALVGVYWVEQPLGYSMVDLSVPLPGQPVEHLSGSVEHPACSTFSVNRGR